MDRSRRSKNPPIRKTKDWQVVCTISTLVSIYSKYPETDSFFTRYSNGLLIVIRLKYRLRLSIIFKKLHHDVQVFKWNHEKFLRYLILGRTKETSRTTWMEEEFDLLEFTVPTNRVFVIMLRVMVFVVLIRHVRRRATELPVAIVTCHGALK